MGVTVGRVLYTILLLALLPWPAASQSSRQVLILNSYHQGFKWTDEQSAGIIAQLEKSDRPTKYFLEYMGTKWAHSRDYLEALPDIYRQKFSTITFDLIIATDDDAFTFLLKHRDDLFGKIPVVFCGVNWFDEKRLQGHSGYTGVNEDADIDLNLDLMLRLHPEVKNVYMVVDQTTTGRIVHRKIWATAPSYRDRITIHILDNLSLAQLDDQVSRLTDDSLVLLTIFQQDINGQFVEFSEIAERLSSHSRVPVYGLWDFYLGFGIVGGMLTSGASQGMMAGELGARILAGEPADAIPVVMKSPNRYRFDYMAMKKAGIEIIKLPAGATLINEPSAFYQVAKESLRAIFIGSVLALLLILFLSLTIYRRIRAERALRESDARYQTLVDNLSLGVYRNGAEEKGKILQANPAMGLPLKSTSLSSMEIPSSKKHPFNGNRLQVEAKPY